MSDEYEAVEPVAPVQETEVQNVGSKKRKDTEVTLEDQAQKVASYIDEGKVGFSSAIIAGLITVVLPMLTNWFSRCSGNDDPAPVAAKAYDPSTDTFDEAVVRKMRAQTRRGCRKKGERHLSEAQLDEISVGVLRHAMNQEQDTTAAVFALCHSPD